MKAAYINQVGEEPDRLLPRNIAVPLCDVAARLGRPPILSYDGYALANWKRFRPDGPIALARLIPAGVDVRGNATRARILLFRKPIERRAKDTADLAELLHEVLVAQVATYLGVEPSVIDPTMDDE